MKARRHGIKASTNIITATVTLYAPWETNLLPPEVRPRIFADLKDSSGLYRVQRESVSVEIVNNEFNDFVPCDHNKIRWIFYRKMLSNVYII